MCRRTAKVGEGKTEGRSFASPALGGIEKVKGRRVIAQNKSKCVEEGSRNMCRYCLVGRCVITKRVGKCRHRRDSSVGRA